MQSQEQPDQDLHCLPVHLHRLDMFLQFKPIALYGVLADLSAIGLKPESTIFMTFTVIILGVSILMTI